MKLNLTLIVLFNLCFSTAIFSELNQNSISLLEGGNKIKYFGRSLSHDSFALSIRIVLL